MLAQPPLAVRIDGVEAELGLQLPQPGDELEPAVDRRHDGLVVRRDLGADLLEALAHVSTAAARAAALKSACTHIPG